jgi:AhpD family alkylhydroperoxidase
MFRRRWRYEPGTSRMNEVANEERKKNIMTESVFPIATAEMGHRRHELAPDIDDAFKTFSRAVFTGGALPEVTKQLIAVAVAHVTQCPYCIDGHTRIARHKGATDEEIMEAIWVAAEMRAGGAFAHSAIALRALSDVPESSAH